MGITTAVRSCQPGIADNGPGWLFHWCRVENEKLIAVEFPFAGLDLSQMLGGQLPGTTRDALNVRGYDPWTLRMRGAQRQGLEKFIEGQVADAVIQDLNMVVHVSSEALASPNYFDPPPQPSNPPDEPGFPDLPLPPDFGPIVEYPPDDPGDPGGDWEEDPNTDEPVGPGGSGYPPPPGRTAPIITWADPADISTGTALSGTQLNVTADVAGTFTYYPPSGTILAAGENQPLRVVFVPDDTSTHFAVSRAVAIDVVNEVTYDVSGTFVAPATTVTAVCRGAGGGGAGGTLVNGGGGGGAGAKVTKLVSGLTIGNSYAVTIGAGGAGGASGAFPGADGDPSNFVSAGTVEAAAGQGGSAAFGGQGGGAGGVGDTIVFGEDGDDAAALTGGNGGDAPLGGGAGGAGGTTGVAGAPGAAPAGGGGGAGEYAVGGLGANGQVVISW